MELDVFINAINVGRLSHDSQLNRYDFTYAKEWLGRADRFPLSAHIPLDTKIPQNPDASSLNIRQFFENLLPEGAALDAAAAAAKVSKSSVAGLLAVLGRETAGAIRILPPGIEEPRIHSNRRPLTREELSTRIRARPYDPFSIWDGRLRLSIAGLQDKVAIYSEGEQWYLVDGGELASTHILKPEPVSSVLHGLASSEFFSMRLAAAVGIRAAAVELLQVPERVLIITRYDRKVAPPGVQRIHVIDGAQALGVSVGAKYERPYGSGRDVKDIRDGASLPRFFELLQESAKPLLERRALLRWAIFQVLIANADAHAKNLSFYSSAEGLSLAPAYDLVSMHAFESNALERTYAMAIGDAFSAEEISPSEWALFAERCKLPRALVARELAMLCDQVRGSVEPLGLATIAEGAERPVITRLITGITRECERQKNLAPSVARVSLSTPPCRR
jgi:serine/threonine-protein kinase HipA